jgi:hypothetical protein
MPDAAGALARCTDICRVRLKGAPLNVLAAVDMDFGAIHV